MAKIFLCIFFLLSSFAYSKKISAIPNDEKGQNFLVFADIHLKKTLIHHMNFMPYFSTVLNDLDETTFVQLLKTTRANIQQGLIPKPKFILLLGDLAGHLRLYPNVAIDNEDTVFRLLIFYFPDVPIIYTFGNNDSLVVNYGPFYNQSAIDYKSPYDVATKKSGWHDGFLSTGQQCRANLSMYPCILEENAIQGYGALYLEPGLRLLSLNTNLFSKKRMQYQEKDAQDQLSWLAMQLEIAKNQHEMVLITMHIPAGRGSKDNQYFWVTPANDKFVNIITQYHANIIGILTAHTHKEEIKILQNSSKKALLGMYNNPSLSTSHGNMPAIKTYFYAKKNQIWQLTNYTVFHFNREKHDAVVLKKLYDYQSYYCHNQAKTLFACLDQVSLAKIVIYYNTGNSHILSKIQENLILY